MFEAAVLAVLAFTAAQGVTLSSTEVDAVGEQQSILRVAEPGMVRLVVDSEVGTACTLVDHLRGPFASSGTMGSKSCALDVLLDAGLYKVRLTSPPSKPAKKGKKAAAKPMARLRASAFANVDGPQLLPRGRSLTTTLPSGSQLVRFVRLPARRELVVDVAGRTAGTVKLWRDGAFIEDVTVTTAVVRAAAGRPVWHHHLETIVDAGDYAIVAYGTDPQAFSTGRDDDTVFIAHDATPLPPSGGTAVTLPAWGFVNLRAPQGSVAVLVERSSADSDVRVEASSVRTGDDGQETRFRSGDGCTIDKEPKNRSCVFVHDDERGSATVLRVTGPAGARVQLQTVATGALNRTAGFGRSGESVELTLPAPAGQVAVIGLPQGTDDVPLSCILERLDDKGRLQGVVGRDLPTVAFTQAWRRRFNSDGTSTALWFAIDKPGLYSIASSTERGAACEIFALANDGSRTRIGSADDKGTCSRRVPLPAGSIEVRLYGGSPGIESLRVGQVGVAAVLGTDDEAPPRTGCLFADAVDGALSAPLAAGRYRLRTNATGGAVLTGVIATAAGVGAGAVVVAADPGRALAITIDRGAGVTVDGSPSSTTTCTWNGTDVPGCRLETVEVRGVLGLRNTGRAPSLLTIRRDDLSAPLAPLTAFAAQPPALPVVDTARTRYFDLDTVTARSFVVDVARAGLYQVQTEGLLQTTCAVRTATSASLFSGEANGRGRNCRVEAFLKPGRYRVDVRAQGRSRGRAGLSLVEKAPWDGGAIVAGDERFVLVPAGAPAKHAITVKGSGPLQLEVAAQDATLQCRLDDNDGWPVLAPPHACTIEPELGPGTYQLTVLPQTVEGRRALRLNTRPTLGTLDGDKTHPLALNVARKAVLGRDGVDRFRFTLSADVDVGITLSNGMQGRLRQALPDGSPGDITDTIAPVGGSAFGIASDDSGDSGEGDGEYSEGGGDGEYSEGGDDGEYNEGGGDGDYSEASAVTASRVRSADALLRATVHQPMGSLAGKTVSLTAGTWILEAEHSRGDVGITYDVAVAVRDLIPGATLQTQVPAVIDVVAPADAGLGLVRLKTRGATDVACRLVDDSGVTVARSSNSGDDWNCALALPLTPGSRSKLYIDAEVLVPGPTTVTAAFLEAKSTGPLKDGDAFRVVGKVARAEVTPTAGRVTDVDLVASEGTFSCAAFDHDGRVVDSHDGVSRCPLLLWGGSDVRPFSVLVWTADRPASIKARLRERDLRRLGGLFGNALSGKGGDVADDGVFEATIAKRGRYETAPNLRCLPKARRGALVACPVAVAADPAVDGDTMLLAVHAGERSTTSFAEVVVDPGRVGRSTRRLGAKHEAERQQTSAPSLHLVDVRARPGSAAQPSCTIDGGARRLDADRCTAASSLGTESVLTLWTRPGSDATVDVRRRSVVVPEQSQPIGTGTVVVTDTARFVLPRTSSRVELAMSDRAWAVLLDDNRRAVDVCAPAVEPADALRRCVFRGQSGTVVVAGVGAFSVRLDVVAFEGAVEPPRALTSLRESVAKSPGQERLVFASATTRRILRIEGPAVLGCRISFANGDERERCVIDIEPGRQGEMLVDHGTGPWRAMIGQRDEGAATRFGPLDGGGLSPLAPQTALAVRGPAAARLVQMQRPGVLRLRASNGVCGIASGARVVASGGLGEGCDLQLVVDAGSYAISMRGFAGAPVGGTMSWSATGLTPLDEGIGAEQVALPGEARFFQIALQSDGALGIGVQVDAEVLDCALLNARGDVVADGCQVFTRLKAGSYTLRVQSAVDSPPRRFRPVVFGLKGADIDVPDSFLQDFFSRVPQPAPTSSSSSSSNQEPR